LGDAAGRETWVSRIHIFGGRWRAERRKPNARDLSAKREPPSYSDGYQALR
jgi:hypothetical protein